MLRGHSIETAVEQFFDDNTHFAVTTRNSWKYTFKALQDRYPLLRINEISSDQLKDFLLFDDAGKPRTIAPGTIKQRRTALSSLFSWCHYAGLIDSDPSSVLKRTVKVKGQGVRQHTWLAETEIRALFDACRNDPNRLLGTRDAVAIGFGIYCGLRLHEIAKVTWQDVNLRTGQLFVIGKGAKPATLPVPPQLVEQLTDWHETITQETGATPLPDSAVLVQFAHTGGAAFGTEASVDPVWSSRLMSPGVKRIVRKRGTEAGIPHLRTHDLRRSYAGLLEDRGVGLRDISSVLRHASIATTERYLADNPKTWQDSVSNAFAGIG